MPVMIPAAGASPSYMPYAASGESSRKGLPGSSSVSTRSRGSSLPRSTCRCRARSPPPWATRRSWSARSAVSPACAAALRSAAAPSAVAALGITGASTPLRLTVVHSDGPDLTPFSLTRVHSGASIRNMTSMRAERDAALHADARRPSRREQILQAAAQLFAERGARAVGVDDVGAAVGVTGPAIYRHFASKDAMLAEMLVRISERLLAGGSGQVADAGDEAVAQLRALIPFQVDFALDTPALITVQDRDLGFLADSDAAQVRRLQRRYVEVWVSVLARVHPGADAATCRARAHAVFGLINSTPHSAGRLGRPAMAELLTRMAWSAATS